MRIVTGDELSALGDYPELGDYVGTRSSTEKPMNLATVDWERLNGANIYTNVCDIPAELRKLRNEASNARSAEMKKIFFKVSKNLLQSTTIMRKKFFVSFILITTINWTIRY